MHIIQRREECSVCDALLSPPPVLYWSMRIEYVMIRKRVRPLKCVVTVAG